MKILWHIVFLAITFLAYATVNDTKLSIGITLFIIAYKALDKADELKEKHNE